MKNIILQHWTGEMDDLGRASSRNISRYAVKIGADYKLLRGDVLDASFNPPMQKLFMLDASFDEYDIVVMLDMDMFTRKGMDKNIFTDESGFGKHTEVQARLGKRIVQCHPKLGKAGYPYWGGAVYRFPRAERIKMRAGLRLEDFRPFNVAYHFEDEGVMHVLAARAGMKLNDNSYMKSNLWECGSFEANVAECYLIHIRTKIAPQGPKRAKIENYRDMVARGLIAP